MAGYLDTSFAHHFGLLLLAVLLGGTVGWERQKREQPAGLRTHILVCLGAALITMIDSMVPGSQGKITGQIVTGVGFLGAGTILRDGSFSVHGLTTAASLWAIAGVGIAIGYGGEGAWLATAATIIILINLTLLNRFDSTINRHRTRRWLTLVVQGGPEGLQTFSEVVELLRARAVKTREIQIDKAADAQLIQINVRMTQYVNVEEINPILSSCKKLIHWEWSD